MCSNFDEYAARIDDVVLLSHLHSGQELDRLATVLSDILWTDGLARLDHSSRKCGNDWQSCGFETDVLGDGLKLIQHRIDLSIDTGDLDERVACEGLTYVVFGCFDSYHAVCVSSAATFNQGCTPATEIYGITNAEYTSNAEGGILAEAMSQNICRLHTEIGPQATQRNLDDASAYLNNCRRKIFDFDTPIYQCIANKARHSKQVALERLNRTCGYGHDMGFSSIYSLYLGRDGSIFQQQCCVSTSRGEIVDKGAAFAVRWAKPLGLFHRNSYTATVKVEGKPMVDGPLNAAMWWNSVLLHHQQYLDKRCYTRCRLAVASVGFD
ncbi:hypothetical protein HG530_011579 [Fusarium avenaceum]|nr:hypothetical protein HG530_011579 [Fusarium avenaceum]